MLPLFPQYLMVIKPDQSTYYVKIHSGDPQ
jgi:hypothetical protein